MADTMVNPKLHGDASPPVITKKTYVLQNVSKGEVTVSHHTDAALALRDFDIDRQTTIVMGNLQGMEEQARYWNAYYTPGTGVGMKKFRKIQWALSHPGDAKDSKLQKLLKDEMFSAMVRPDPMAGGYWVVNPETGGEHLIHVKNKEGKIMIPKQKHYHNWIQMTRPVTGKEWDFRKAQIRKLEDSLVGKIGIGGIDNEMSRLYAAAELAYGPPVTTSAGHGRVPKRLQYAANLAAHIKQTVIQAKNIKTDTMVEHHAERVASFVQNLRDIRPDMVRSYFHAADDPVRLAELRNTPVGRLMTEYPQEWLSSMSFGLNVRRSLVTVAKINEKGMPLLGPKFAQEYLIDQARPVDMSMTESGEYNSPTDVNRYKAAVDSYVAGDMGLTSFGRQHMVALHDKWTTPPNFLEPAAPKDYYHAYSRRGFREALGDYVEDRMGKGTRVVGESAGNAAIRHGGKAVAGLSLAWFALNFFRPNQMRFMGPRPGEGGERYDWSGGGSDLPRHIPIDIPFYTWDRPVRLQTPNFNVPAKVDHLFSKLSSNFTYSPHHMNPKGAIYPRVSASYRNDRDRGTDIMITRSVLAAGGSFA